MSPHANQTVLANEGRRALCSETSKCPSGTLAHPERGPSSLSSLLPAEDFKTARCLYFSLETSGMSSTLWRGFKFAEPATINHRRNFIVLERPGRSKTNRWAINLKLMNLCARAPLRATLQLQGTWRVRSSLPLVVIKGTSSRAETKCGELKAKSLRTRTSRRIFPLPCRWSAGEGSGGAGGRFN